LHLNGNDLSIITVKKDGMVDNLQFYPSINLQNLSNVLTELPEIYSDMTLLVSKQNFITIPENFYEVEFSDLFKLNYNLADEDTIGLDKSDYGIGIVYALNKDIANLITTKFPRVKIRHEANVLLKKLFKEVNFKQPRILISINNDILILMAISDGNLILCNSYQTKTNDDIFYFVLLALEQLNFIPAETELVILGEPPSRTEIFELFKNYIREINIWMEELKVSDKIANTALLSNSFALQVLICE
jgi:hypothetical protein